METRPSGDIADPDFCQRVVGDTRKAFGGVDILVNNAAEQTEIKGVEDLHPQQVEQTFRTNIVGFFYLTKRSSRICRPGRPISHYLRSRV